MQHKLGSEIDLSILEKVINLIILKNDSFRLRFKTDKGIKYLFKKLNFFKRCTYVKQYVSEYEEKKFEFYELSSEYAEWVKLQSIKLFDLYDSDLYSFIFLKLNTGEYVVFLRIHHIITDGWSLNLVISQIGEYYTKIKNGLLIDLHPNPSYIDLILKEEKYQKTDKFRNDKKLLFEKFKNAPESALFKKKMNHRGNCNYKTFILSPDITKIIYKLCENVFIYPLILFTAAIVRLIKSKTNINDIILIMLYHNRVSKQEMETTGMYSKAIPMRIKLGEKMNLKMLSNKIFAEYKFSINHGQEAAIMNLLENGNKFYRNAILISSEKYPSDNTGIVKSIEFHDLGYVSNPLIFQINDYNQAGFKLKYEYQTNYFSDIEIDDLQREIENIIIQFGKGELDISNRINQI